MLSRRLAAAGLLGLPFAFPAVAQTIASPAASAPADEPPTQIGAGVDRDTHLTAPVTINGQGPFPFLIDTGANISCVSRELAGLLNLPAGPPAQVNTMVGVQTRPSVIIDRLQVGGRDRRKVMAPSLPMSGGLPVMGVLGVDWLKGQRLVLGIKAKTLEITSSRRDVSVEGQIVVPAQRRWGQLTIVDADISGHRFSALVDSGAQMTLANDAMRKLVDQIDAHHGRVGKVQRITMETLAGEPFSGDLLYLPFVRLGGLTIGNMPVVHAETHVFDIWDLQGKPAIVLGMDLLNQFAAVTLDYGRSAMRFDI